MIASPESFLIGSAGSLNKSAIDNSYSLSKIIKKTRRKVYRYQKGDYESMRSDALKFAKERYFNGYSVGCNNASDYRCITIVT